MKLLVYYNTNSGRYYCKIKAVIFEPLKVVTSQGHILVAIYDIQVKDVVPFNYRLAYFFERLSTRLKFGKEKRIKYVLKRYKRFK